MHDVHPTVTTASEGRPMSAAAVASLVFGLLLCIPGAGLIGTVTGVIGLASTGPTGMKRGRGIAISGLVISILSLFGWIVTGVVAVQGWNAYVKPSMEVVISGPDRTLQAAFKGDVTAFDADWMPGRAPSAAERTAFVSGVTLALGEFKGAEIQAGAQPPTDSMSGNAEDFELPWTFTFENGACSGVVTYRPSRRGETTPGGAYVGIDAIEITSPSGTRFTLGGGDGTGDAEPTEDAAP
jgi:hypothetical protein